VIFSITAEYCSLPVAVIERVRVPDPDATLENSAPVTRLVAFAIPPVSLVQSGPPLSERVLLPSDDTKTRQRSPAEKLAAVVIDQLVESLAALTKASLAATARAISGANQP